MPLPFHPNDAIAAVASPPGPAPRGIVRLSGRQIAPIVAATFQHLPHFLPASDTAEGLSPVHAAVYEGAVHLEQFAQPVPTWLYSWPTRRSYTGEPLAEFHLIGSPPLLDALLKTLFAAGVRLAEPGEFTFRAFLAGRVDLLQVEAVAAVIDAQDHGELQIALGQLAGGVSQRLTRLRASLLDLLADLEAGLDFAEEALDFVSHADLLTRLSAIRCDVEALHNQAAQRTQTAVTPTVVLAGPPNVGKSTLFNALVGRPAALVSAHRGTTRDYLTADLVCDGLAIRLVDTAGIEHAREPISTAAQRFAADQAAHADLLLWCRAADESASEAPLPPWPPALALAEERILRIQTRSDLRVGHPPVVEGAICVSAHTGHGLAALQSAIAARLTGNAVGTRELTNATAARCHEGLSRTAAALDRSLKIAWGAAGQELLALELREALDELGTLVGAVYTDDLLDRIFSRFCIGK